MDAAGWQRLVDLSHGSFDRGRAEAGRSVSGNVVAAGSGSDPRAYWSVSATRGNRYEITSVTVQVRRQVLVSPTSPRTALDSGAVAAISDAPGLE